MLETSKETIAAFRIRAGSNQYARACLIDGRSPLHAQIGNRSLPLFPILALKAFAYRKLNVVIQGEFVRVRPEPYRFGFRAALVADEGLDQLLAENISF